MRERSPSRGGGHKDQCHSNTSTVHLPVNDGIVGTHGLVERRPYTSGNRERKGISPISAWDARFTRFQLSSRSSVSPDLNDIGRKDCALPTFTITANILPCCPCSPEMPEADRTAGGPG